MIETIISLLVFGLLAGLPSLILVLLPELLREKPAAIRARICHEETEKQHQEHLAACTRIRPMLRPGTPDTPWDPFDPDHQERIRERVTERLAALGLLEQPQEAHS